MEKSLERTLQNLASKYPFTWEIDGDKLFIYARMAYVDPSVADPEYTQSDWEFSNTITHALAKHRYYFDDQDDVLSGIEKWTYTAISAERLRDVRVPPTVAYYNPKR
jgi:hypothetical protein